MLVKHCWQTNFYIITINFACNFFMVKRLTLLILSRSILHHIHYQTSHEHRTQWKEETNKLRVIGKRKILVSCLWNFSGTMQSTVYTKSLPIFIYNSFLMKRGTQLILDHGVEDQVKLWHYASETLWAPQRPHKLGMHSRFDNMGDRTPIVIPWQGYWSGYCYATVSGGWASVFVITEGFPLYSIVNLVNTIQAELFELNAHWPSDHTLNSVVCTI